MKILSLWFMRGGDVQLLISRLYIKIWIKFQTLPKYIQYVEKTYSILLLIVIRPSDGVVKPDGLIGAYRQE